MIASSSPTRRNVLVTASALAGASVLPAYGAAAGEGAAIRPFRVNVPDEALADLRRRIAATRWPDKETVADETQGVQLATVQSLIRYWGTDHDWRKVEAKLNSLPQFITNDRWARHSFHSRSLEA